MRLVSRSVRTIESSGNAGKALIARLFATNPAAVSDAPAHCSECEIDVFGSCFGFVHTQGSQLLQSRASIAGLPLWPQSLQLVVRLAVVCGQYGSLCGSVNCGSQQVVNEIT